MDQTQRNYKNDINAGVRPGTTIDLTSVPMVRICEIPPAKFVWSVVPTGSRDGRNDIVGTANRGFRCAVAVAAQAPLIMRIGYSSNPGYDQEKHKKSDQNSGARKQTRHQLGAEHGG